MYQFAIYGESQKNNLSSNDDSILINQIGDYIVMMVADGNTGTEGMINFGMLANNMMFEYLKKIIGPTTSIQDIVNQLSFGMYTVSQAFLAINAINDQYSNIYASQSIVIISQTSLETCLASIGNTEIQLWRNQQFVRMNTLHSKGYDMLMNGQVAEADFYNCPERGLLTSAYGVFPEIKTDIKKGNFNLNDIILLTTDGVYAALNPGNVVDLLVEGDTPEGGVKKVLEATNNKGGIDNAGLICCFISDSSQNN